MPEPSYVTRTRAGYDAMAVEYPEWVRDDLAANPLAGRNIQASGSTRPSMTALTMDDGALAGLVAWYSIIHLPPAESVPQAHLIARKPLIAGKARRHERQQETLAEGVGEPGPGTT